VEAEELKVKSHITKYNNEKKSPHIDPAGHTGRIQLSTSRSLENRFKSSGHIPDKVQVMNHY